VGSYRKRTVVVPEAYHKTQTDRQASERQAACVLVENNTLTRKRASYIDLLLKMLTLWNVLTYRKNWNCCYC
jgi:hypothetical protein